jgi:general secretion pathway protein C
MKIIRAILPFFVITALCVGGVELFYRFALPSLFSLVVNSRQTARVGRELEGRGATGEKTRNYQVILDRNLFGTGPVHPDTGKSQSNPLAGLSLTTLDVILLGTITGDNDDKRAIIMDKDQKKQEIYHMGDSIQGMTIKDILREKIILGFRGRDEILDMTEARQYFAETAAVAPSPGQQKAFPAPEEIQPALPVDGGIQIAPSLRKFSIQTDTKVINK